MPKIIKNGIEYGSASHAENVSYDRSRTTPPNILASNNVQDAIDEVAEGISSVSNIAQGLISTKQDKITSLSNICTKISLLANTTKTITVTSDGASRVGFIVYSVGAQGNLAPIMYLVGGYVTASRCSVTNISGKTGVTIDASSTTGLTFGFTNTTAITIDLFFLPLFDNTFT